MLMNIKHTRYFIILLFLLLYLQVIFATPTSPTSDFIDNKDGTVTHKTTELTWMRCAMGQQWTGSTCQGKASTYTYSYALALTSTFAGHTDWRLPNIAELQTIVEYANSELALNKTIFPTNLSDFPDPVHSVFRSASPVVDYADNAWYVSLYHGSNGYGGNNVGFVVRLVRSGQSLPNDLTTPYDDFIDNQDGTVTHKRTGLMWQRCSVGQIWTDSTCKWKREAGKYTYDQALALTDNFANHKDWRLPNVLELVSIVEYGSSNPVINRELFPNTPRSSFWTSSPSYLLLGKDFPKGNLAFAWNVDFSNGRDDTSLRSNLFEVRLVRNTASHK